MKNGKSAGPGQMKMAAPIGEKYVSGLHSDGTTHARYHNRRQAILRTFLVISTTKGTQLATGISVATISGNVTRDGELNESGKVLSFGVAVNRYHKEDGEAVHFFDCKRLGNGASGLAPYITKGSKITVHGDLVQERWEAQDGSKRSVVRILAREIVLGGARDSSEPTPEAKPDDDTGW